ncbi:probable disease resistance protein At1g61300 [Neltuma alba]|uniref:probable disease resistance protein At1g61300 n=1 Tax=Neltuma alba TaxID=207710 RepID=UPI0010A34787|nr:probable disease resistance protein At1g61300 [Prosopis alba]XP_028789428.1 probable disease resistance protein At1g61300 [Prosopis alba]
MGWHSRYWLARNVLTTYKLVRALGNKIQGLSAAADNDFERPLLLANEMPLPDTVGMDSKLKKLIDFTGEDNSGIVGLYGMGGSGKTTLMRKVYNSVIADVTTRQDNALVIWIDMAGGCDIEKIIDDLRENCKIDNVNWEGKSRDYKAKEVFNELKGKKYILFLDGAGGALNLEDIGVPPPNEANRSKIFIATRFENVCDQMKAEKFKVECLEEKDALDLLCRSAGINSESALGMVARELSQECEGFPPALVAVGQDVAGLKKLQSWKHNLKKLKNFPSKVKGMEKDVFITLKSSYDSLPTTIEKNCFLYFALFPKGEIVSVPDLIRLWIGEGLLGNHDSIQDAINHGVEVVENLMVASLLEDYGDNSVKMHNVIRQMALWLARDQDQRRDKVLVQDEALRSSQECDGEKWKTVEKISVSDNHAQEVLTWDGPVCPNAETLIVWCNKVQIKDFEKVGSMSKLKVLSLRHIQGITTLPKEIGRLIHLEYLDLSYLNIQENLPVEMINLTRLRVFLLEHVHFSLEVISKEVISCLKSLMVFSFWREIRSSETTNEDPSSSTSFTSPYLQEKSFLERLEQLPFLEDISLTLETPSGINKLLSSDKLRHCIRNVGLIHQQNEETTETINAPVTQSLSKMELLEVIHLVAWRHWLEESSLVDHQIDIFRQLSEVQILDSFSVTHLTWLRFAPVLRSLKLVNCLSLEEVIMEIEEDVDSVFGNLDSMVLTRLPRLWSVCKKTLPFPKLIVMEITGCNNLNKLPLDRNSATNTLKHIRGETRWWDNLEWEDSMAKEFFQAKFTDINNS